MGIINWLEIQNYTSWAMSKSDESAAAWDRGASGWQKRIDFEKNFTQAQVDACDRITKDTIVLDACCGTGRTAIPFARKAKHVYAVDAGEKMLEYCSDNAKEEGIENITVKRIPNWHTCEPGKEIPIADIAVSVISPAQADIVKFSKCAKEYCYFLSFTKDPYRYVMRELFSGTTDEDRWSKATISDRPINPGGPVISAVTQNMQCPLNVQFNILYDMGVLPEVKYADGAWEHVAETREEIYDYLRMLSEVAPDKEDIFRANCDKRISRLDSGLYRYAYESQMYVLGWDPNQLR